MRIHALISRLPDSLHGVLFCLAAPKLFLTFLGLCLVPLLLLASINYWTGVRAAEAALQQEQQRNIAASQDPITQILNENKRQALHQPQTLNRYSLLRTETDGIGVVAALLARYAFGVGSFRDGGVGKLAALNESGRRRGNRPGKTGSSN